MINIISSLFYRLFHSKYFYVCMAILFLSPLLEATLLKFMLTVLEELGGYGMEMLTEPLALLSAECNIVSNAATLIAIAVALLVGTDFSEGLVRNALVSNKKRIELYGAYMIVTALIVLCYCAVDMLSASVFYITILGNPAGHTISYYVGASFAYFGIQVLSMYFIGVMTVFLCVVFKKVSTPLIISLLLINVVFSMALAGSQFLTAFGGDYTALTWIPLFNISLIAGTMDGGLIAKCVLGLVVVIVALAVGMPFYLKKTDIR